MGGKHERRIEFFTTLILIQIFSLLIHMGDYSDCENDFNDAAEEG